MKPFSYHLLVIFEVSPDCGSVLRRTPTRLRKLF